MKLLHRRIFGECLKVFVLSLAVLLLFILMGRAIQLREMLLGLELGIMDTLRLFGYLSPFFLSMLAPVAAMLAVFLTFLRMGTDKELVALKAGGVSLYQMLPAPLLFGCLCTLFSLWLSLFVLSWGMGEFRSSILNIASSHAKIVLQPGTFNQSIPNMVFFARQADPTHGTLAHIMVEDSSYPEMKLTILAPQGNLDTDYNRGEIVFLLKNGKIYTEQGQKVTVLGFEEYAVRLALDKLYKGLDLGPVKPKEMAWAELTALDTEKISVQNQRIANKIVVERHKRWIFPVACLVLIVFAIPMATSFQGVHRQSGLVLGLALFLVYYSVISVGISLGEASGVSPWLGLWLPSLCFLLMGMYGIYLVANERMPRMAEFLQRLGSRKKSSRKEASA